MGGLKKAYRIVALLALAHLLAIGGLVVYLVATGRLTGDRLEQMAAVMRGGPREVAAEQVEATEPVVPPAKSAQSIGQGQTAEEISRYKADRRVAELDQQAATIADARLEIMREREAHRRDVEESEAQFRRRQQQEQSEGFKKDLALLGGMKAKTAVYHLLQMPIDEAARVLSQMPTRKANKIIEAAKGSADLKKMSEILRTMRDLAPDSAASRSKKKGS